MSFEEKFPSLKGFSYIVDSAIIADGIAGEGENINSEEVIATVLVEEHCLDKSHVKNAILSIKNQEYYEDENLQFIKGMETACDDLLKVLHLND